MASVISRYVKLSTLVLLAWTVPVAANPGSAVRCDFDGDGHDDLAIGAPSEAIGSKLGAGSVNVIMGQGSGLSSLYNQIYYQDSSNVEGVSEEGDAFGAALACGDFNHDGWDDLAIGVPNEDIGSIANAGAVNVIYGTPFGLNPTLIADQSWHQNNFGSDPAETGDRLGSSLATDDFNHDGYLDLAIGVPGEDQSGRNAGAVAILYGGFGGLTSTGAALFHQDTPGIEGSTETSDSYGEVLASGDFNSDGYADLAIGVPLEDVGSIKDAGVVNVLYGTPSGLTATGDHLFDQDDLLGAPDVRKHFGAALATGDFNNDGYTDLAVGVPGATVSGFSLAGEVSIIFGASTGLTPWANQLWTQDVGTIAGTAEEGDRFGHALASGDFDNDGYDDLAIGAPGEAIGSKLGAGLVNILLGTSSGLDDTDNVYWHQDSALIDAAEAGDAFGRTLSTADFDGDGYDDLAIGVPGESIFLIAAGMMQVMYGTSSGLSSVANQVWHQGRADIAGAAEAGDLLGGVNVSAGIYRIAYTNGTLVNIHNDQYGHSLRIDMDGHGGGPYTLVAAADGIVRAVVDSNAEPTSNNNYVWIEHDNGEWTKYSHMEQGSVPIFVVVGAFISAGAPIGIESDVGVAQGDHLHFNVAVPDDPSNPISGAGFVIGDYRIPRICGIPGGVFVRNEFYTADDC